MIFRSGSMNVCVKSNGIAFLITIAVFLLCSNAADALNSCIVCNSTSNSDCIYKPEIIETQTCDNTANTTCFTLFIDLEVYRGCFNESDELIQKYCMTVGNNTECSTCENEENELAACNDDIFLKHHRSARRGGHGGHGHGHGHGHGGGSAGGAAGIFVLVAALSTAVITWCAVFCCCKGCHNKSKDSNGVVIRRPGEVIQQIPGQTPLQMVPLNQQTPAYGYPPQPIYPQNSPQQADWPTTQPMLTPNYPYPIQTFPYNNSTSNNAQTPYDALQRDYTQTQPTAPKME